MLLLTATMHCLTKLLLFKGIIAKLPRGAEWPGYSRRDPRAKPATATTVLLRPPSWRRCRMAAAEAASTATTLAGMTTRKNSGMQMGQYIVGMEGLLEELLAARPRTVGG